jgi:hypothetical protein
MKPISILLPVKVGYCKYTWKELEVKESKEKNAGQGVFAKESLRVGTMIPIIGKQVSSEVRGTHTWVRHGKKKAIDGNPEIKPYDGIGNFGLSIAMMINESTKKKPNCKFRYDYVVVCSPIKKGQELILYYGNDYNRVGYSVEKNKHIPDAEYPAYFKIAPHKYPKNRKEVLEYWDTVVAGCERKRKPPTAIAIRNIDGEPRELSP